MTNHVSWVDALLIAATASRPVRFVMDHRIFATPVPNKKTLMKLKNAAHTTACVGVSTRVETIVAIELAAS